jgi:hypothetical protein
MSAKQGEKREGLLTWGGSALGSRGRGRAATRGRVDLYERPRPTRGEEAAGGGGEGSPEGCRMVEEGAGHRDRGGGGCRRHDDERSCWRLRRPGVAGDVVVVW